MVKSMHKSKTRKENATPLQKTQSKLQKKIDGIRKFNKMLSVNLSLRKEQNRRDHYFIEILREKYPDIYAEVVSDIKQKYPNMMRLKDLKKKILKNDK